jgi:hypothetical protein
MTPQTRCRAVLCRAVLCCAPTTQVYDVTSYLDDHPGGSDSILQNSGVDCTDEFMSVHSQVWLCWGVRKRCLLLCEGWVRWGGKGV